MTTIISGAFKATKLLQPPSNITRPVSQKVRGAIFSAIGSGVVDSSVLDVFAGSGALGLEALSRGANHCVFVEHSRRVVGILRKNAMSVATKSSYNIVATDATKYMQACDSKFQLIFLDPPYALFSISLVKQALNLLQSNGILVVSCSSKTVIEPQQLTACTITVKTYGDTQILFIQN